MVKKKKSNTKKKYDYQMSNMKGLMGTGLAGMAGMGAIGAMNSIPGMPANNIGATVGAGVNLANIGNLAHIGMNIIPKDGWSSNRALCKHAWHGRICKKCGLRK